MNQKTLAATLRKNQYLTFRESAKILQDILDIIREELRAGHKVRLRNFGTFITRNYLSKIYQDVHTKKIKTLPARKKVKFQPSKNILG